jgi:hypothetical protein
VTNAATIAAEIIRRLPEVKSGSLAVFGDIFGGRIDNIHVVTSARAAEDSEWLIIEFDQGETLEIWDPADASIAAQEFRIQRASRVRWECFYYGLPHSAENRYFIEHVRQDDRILVTTNADWAGTHFSPALERAAVELLGMW